MKQDPISDCTQTLGTREMILNQSLKLINEQGMADFRIDTVSAFLSLSPGNITYHFSRKEDIFASLWREYISEYNKINLSLTSLLDVKQLYLMNRINIFLAYKYRGILISRSADLGSIARDTESNQINFQSHNEITDEINRLLIKNGYIKPYKGNEDIFPEITMNHYIVMRWVVNFAYQLYPESEIEANLERLSLLSLHAHYPVFTQKGRDQFMEIAQIVEQDQIKG